MNVKEVRTSGLRHLTSSKYPLCFGPNRLATGRGSGGRSEGDTVSHAAGRPATVRGDDNRLRAPQRRSDVGRRGRAGGSRLT